MCLCEIQCNISKAINSKIYKAIDSPFLFIKIERKKVLIHNYRHLPADLRNILAVPVLLYGRADGCSIR